MSGCRSAASLPINLAEKQMVDAAKNFLDFDRRVKTIATP
jgi:hypothetical protein